MTENEVFEHISDLAGDYKCFDEKISHRESLILCNLIEEIQQYRAIGTIEEFKALKEKSVAKKPIYSDFDNNGYDEIIPYKAICPICGNEFELGSWNEEENHHCICGQKLDWQMKGEQNERLQ